jgi:hypothetical protein
MANEVIEVNSQGEIRYWEFDFTGELEDDTTLKNIGSGSTINAFNHAGTDVGATILQNKTRTDMKLSVEIKSVTNGEDYRIEFLAVGNDTSRASMKVLEVRARRFMQGSA